MKICQKCSNFFPDDINVCPLDNIVLSQSGDSNLGKVVGGCYRIHSFISKGGMGSVYLAKHRYLNRNVAIKILNQQMSSDESMRKRIIREARICASLEHPNIVKVYDLATLEGSMCIVMEFLEGKTLKEVLRFENTLTVERTLKIMQMIAEALSRAHSFNIIHRDIKPANIFLTSYRDIDDFVKLLDFGIAYTIGGARLTQKGMLLGTPAYVPPERIKGEEPTKASDIYSLGCVVYEMLTGKSPFASQNIEEVITGHLFRDPAPLKEIRQDIPDSLSSIILKMLEKNPQNRYQDAFELLEDMKFNNLYSKITGENVVRASEGATSIEGSNEIVWNNYFDNISKMVDDDTAQTIEFSKGVEAANELFLIEQKIAELVMEIEKLDNKRREYHRNIAIALETLQTDLAKQRRELGKTKMEHIAQISEIEYLTSKVNEIEEKIMSLFSQRKNENGKISDEEIEQIILLSEMVQRLREINEKEKKNKENRNELKFQIEDLKYQILQLNKRVVEIDEEFAQKHDDYINEIDKLSTKAENLRSIAAFTAQKVASGIRMSGSLEKNHK